MTQRYSLDAIPGVTRYFLDTEFIEDGTTIDLVSIGVVAEDGREYYAVSVDADLTKAGEFVQKEVLPHLPPTNDLTWKSRDQIRDEVRWFFDGGGKPEVWGYFADYDWVVLCQLFGRMVDLPHFMPHFCMDLKQLAVMLGNPVLPKQDGAAHHALADARWNRQAFEFLRALR